MFGLHHQHKAHDMATKVRDASNGTPRGYASCCMVGVWRWMGVCWAKFAKLDPNVFGLKLPKSRKSGFWASCKSNNFLTASIVPTINYLYFNMYRKASNYKADFYGMPSCDITPVVRPI